MDTSKQEWKHMGGRYRVAQRETEVVVEFTHPNLCPDGEFIVYEGWRTPERAADFLEGVARVAQRKAQEAAEYATMIREQAAAFRKMESEPPPSGEKG